MLRRLMQAVGRNRGRVIAAATVAVGLTAFAVSHAATEAASLIKVRMGGDGPETRLVLELDGATSARVLADGASDRRIVVLLPGVTAQQAQQGVGRGVVKAWTLDQTNAGARLQIDLAADGTLKRRFLLPPADGVASYRYVLDVAAGPPTARLISARTTPATPTLRSQFLPPRRPGEPVKLALPPPKPALPLKKVVVIDAGHGGKDPGSLGANGYEKDINLAAAITLADQLGKTGRYKVVLTRSTDVYIPLEDRVRVAQRAGADLFISLHSDSGPEADLKGASVYTLSDKGTARSARFVAQDNWLMKTSLAGDQGVRDILFDLTQRATRNRSAVFAQTLVAKIDGQAPMLRHSHRDAGFMVLLAPDVPAVLLEMGFVSNPTDEARLRDPAARARFMAAVARAIDSHFDESLKLASR
jgi:N-acetylmuramoyl-L-alanine amidase